jgi:hypothetical protein
MKGLMFLLMLLASAGAQAQIYTCKGKDGSTVFSDQKCGPDAKVVKGSAAKTQKKSAKPAAAAPKPRVQRPAAELEDLLAKCDTGDTASCNAWTLGGGPNLLRENEHKAELECEAGSLAACEERYCREGPSEECRERVMRTARLAGDTWYVRSEDRNRNDGAARYAIRCMPRGEPKIRDITITCAGAAGPNRCFLSDPQHGQPRLDAAAAAHCST